MHQVTNPIQACNDIFFKPNGVFHAIGQKDNWSWLPFLIVSAMAVLPAYLYFNTVDFAWYQDLLMTSQFGEMSPAERDAMREGMSRSNVVISTVIITVLSLIIVNAIIAGYLNVAGRSDDECVHGFTDWYGFTWWVGMPMLLNSIIAILLLLLADTHQIAPTILSPLSMAFVLGTDVSSDWFGLFQFLRLDVLWSVYLMMVGLRHWTQFSPRKATLIAVVPYLVIIAIWLVVIML